MLSKTKEGNGEWILLDFVSEIRKIVQNNIGSILKYEKEKKTLKTCAFRQLERLDRCN